MQTENIEEPEIIKEPKVTLTFKLYPGKQVYRQDSSKPFECDPKDAEKWQKKGYGIIVNELINDSELGEIQKTEDENVIVWNGDLWKKVPQQSEEKTFLHAEKTDSELEDEHKSSKKGKK